MPLKLMVTREVAPSEIFNMVLGTGATSWSWWGGALFRNDDNDVEAEEQMTEHTVLHLHGVSPGDDDVMVEYKLTMQEIVNAAGVVLAAGKIHEESAQDMCSEDLGFADAGDADLVLQQAVFGKIIFG